MAPQTQVSQQDIRPGQMKILRAVSTLLENPSGKITMARVAREVGVTDAAIYRHYDSKEDIFKALMDYMESNFLGPITTVQEETPNTKKRLETLFFTYMEFFDGHPGLARIFLGHGSEEAAGFAGRLQLLNAKLRSQLAQILRQGEAQAMLSPTMTPELATELFYGLIVGAAMAQVYDFPQVEAVDRCNMFLQLTFR